MTISDEYKYEEIEAATENFSLSRLIGKGSHGCVFKGILEDGKEVAIKKQSLGLQKLHDNSKLENEAFVLSSLPQNNPHLITLLGTSHDSAMNRVLVMDYMPNGTLHHLLHASFSPPTWPKRVEIAIRVAQAVQFLHETKPSSIIHRDIKSANVLFDSNWNAKLADFGLAIMNSDSVSHDDSDSVNRPAGTIGYLDPCYTQPSKLSTKIDIFSYGVILLEIISCRKVIDVAKAPASIVDWAMPLIEKGRVFEICDKRVDLPECTESAIKKMLSVASNCVSLDENERPSMREVVLALQNLSMMEEPVKVPPWLNGSWSIAILRRYKKMKCNTNAATTIACVAHQAKSHLDVSRRKMLLREVLADVTLE